MREGEILIPRIKPLDLASQMRRLRPSMTRMKRRGDKGHPCQIPREAVKKVEGVPLIRTAKLTEERHPIIQLTVRRGIPI